MKKALRKIYREKLSFDVAIPIGRLEAVTGIQLGLACFTEEQKKSITESFGLFGGSANDSNKYYDGVSASSVTPKPEDYIDVPFRLLSATVVGAGSWKASDFSDVALLRNSYKLLDGKPVYKNHDLSDVDNWIGLVKSPKWTDGFVQDGVAVPPGIDGIISIDIKTAPKMARAVLSGAVYSKSVTIEFDWTPSHEFEDENEFLYKIGSMGKDGKMVRRVATAIHNYHESSMVFLGADPFAKLIDKDGKLRSIDVGSIEYSKACLSYDKATEVDKQAYTEEKTIHKALGLDAGVLAFAKGNFDKNKKKPEEDKPNPQKTTTSNNNEPEMKKLLALLAATMVAADKNFKFTAEQFTPENDEAITAAFQKFLEEKNKGEQNLSKAVSFDTVIGLPVLEVAEDKTTETKVTLTEAGELPEKMAEEFAFVKKANFTELFDKVTSLRKDADLGQQFLKDQRAEAVRLYKLSAGDAVSDAVVQLMEKAEPEALKGLLAQYGKKALENFGGSCKGCGSTDISFRSSVEEENEGKNTDANTGSGKSFTQIYQDKNFRPMGIGRGSSSGK